MSIQSMSNVWSFEKAKEMLINLPEQNFSFEKRDEITEFLRVGGIKDKHTFITRKYEIVDWKLYEEMTKSKDFLYVSIQQVINNTLTEVYRIYDDREKDDWRKFKSIWGLVGNCIFLKTDPEFYYNCILNKER